MARDVQDIAKELLLTALDGHGKSSDDGKSSHGLSGATGMVAGAGAAALAPMAFRSLAKSLGLKQASDLVKSPGEALGGLTSRLGESVGAGLGDKVGEKVDEAGGPAGMLGDAVKSALPFGGGDDGGGARSGAPGAGKGRRMPVQQSVDIGLPLETVYNQWTQFEDWPSFMHRVTRASQEDESTVSFAVKIWGKTKEFTAEIETQRPNERVKWRVTQGMIHTGVVTFHEIGPNLTRMLLSLDVEPGSLIEKAARGMRLVKRAARGDLHRFKGFLEMAEHETGAWRGTIEEGDVVEEHDAAYDRKREYADLDDLVGSAGDSDDDDAAAEDDDGDSEAAEPKRGRARQARGRAAASTPDSKSTSRKGSARSSGGGPARGRSAGTSKAASSGSSSRTRRGASSTSKSRSGGSGTRSRGSKS
jgi:uncharacterized membrane protein